MNKKIYGYDYADGKYVVIEFEAEIVKWLSSTVLAYIEHPPKVLVDAVILRWKECYQEEISYEDAEKKVSYDSILEYITAEINNKHLLFSRSPVKTVDELKAILALTIDETKEKLTGVAVSDEQIQSWKKRIIEMTRNPVYSGAVPDTKEKVSVEQTHESIVPPSLYNKVQEKIFGNANLRAQRAETKQYAEKKGMVVLDSPEDIARAGGVVCELCGQRMLKADGCTCSEIEIKGIRFRRIRLGDEEFSMGDNCCHDCGARVGHYHHHGCDAEECPACGGQLMGCTCEFDYVTEK